MKRLVLSSLLSGLLFTLTPCHAYAQNTAPLTAVPGTLADDRNAVTLADLVIQFVNTFKPETAAPQFERAISFFSPSLATDSRPYFAKKLGIGQADQRLSLFVPDPATIDINRYRQDNVIHYDVLLQGLLKTIIAEQQIEAVPLKILVQMEKIPVTTANPYGFMVVSYREMPLPAAAVATPLAVVPETGQNSPNASTGSRKQ